VSSKIVGPYAAQICKDGAPRRASFRVVHDEVKLILWDVDQTLIESRGLGRELYAEAFAAATGEAMERLPAFAGRTEPAIAADVLRVNGIEPTVELVQRIFDALISVYRAGTDRLRHRGRALPGATAALEALAGRRDVVSSVLTGNLEPVALVKLAAFGLDLHLDLGSGAYGSDEHTVRSELVAVARARAQRNHGTIFSTGTTILVGDTPNDMHAGIDGGALPVGVATGHYSADELRAAGAAVVLDDLTDLPHLLTALGPP
jgi:phosphoglycolate phosphatase